MKDGKLGYGIIGCGVIGPWHRASVLQCEDADLLAVCDVEEEKAKAFLEEVEGDVAVYTDYQEMLKRDDLDVVSICTPSGLHSKMAVAAAEAGKHVLSEKPLAITLPQADAMIEACREHNVKLGCIFQRRTYETSKMVREAVQGGELGQLTLGDAYLKYYRSQAYYNSAGWRGTWELDGGGALMNQGVHGIDLLLWIMGDVDMVYAKSTALVRDIEVEDTAVALVTYKSGAYGVIEGTTSCNPGESTMHEIHGKLGTIILSDKGIERWAATTGEDDRAEEVEGKKEADRTAGGGTGDPTAIGMYGHITQVADMVAAIKEDRDPMVTGESARKAVELILGIYESSRTGKEVKLGV